MYGRAAAVRRDGLGFHDELIARRDLAAQLHAIEREQHRHLAGVLERLRQQQAAELREKLAAKGVVLKVSLRRNERAGAESFELASVEGGSKSKVKFKLNTMIDAGLGDSQYWLDSGSVR